MDVPKVELVPILTELRRDVELLEADLIGRALDLDVAAGAEVDVLAFGQLQNQTLDEGGDVVVSYNFV